MDDLRRRFASLDRLPAPDLWDAIELRAAAHDPVARVTAVVTPLPMRSRRSTRRSLVLLAAIIALLVALVAGALVIGSRRPPLPAIVTVPSASVEASHSASVVPAPSASVEASRSPSSSVAPEPHSRVVAYTVLKDECVVEPSLCVQRIWVANTDGSGAHELLPDVPRRQEILGWVPDGSRLLYLELRGDGSADVFATDAAGSKPELICAAGAGECPFVSGATSPDGTRLAYVISEGGSGEQSTVAILDLSTRKVTKLETTRATRPRPCAATSPKAGWNSRPRWSPDGTRLVFERDGTGKTLELGSCRGATIFLVNVDGSGLSQVTSADIVAFEPTWSPDGTRIVFGGDERRPSTLLWATDLYTIRPDGTDIQRLTTDGGTGSPGWTTDGRIVFRHLLPGGTFDGLRLMNADGTDESPIKDDDLARLTAAGCATCAYAPASPNGNGGWPHGDAYWQPAPGDQP